MNIEQVPESRRAILQTLKLDGPHTIAQLAARLHMTGEAVRQHLMQLHRDSWVEAVVDREAGSGRPGRPAARYRLTVAGDHLFPKRYEGLAVALLDGVEQRLGPQAQAQVLASLADAQVRAWTPRLRGLDLRAKLEALRGLYQEADPYAEVGQDERGLYLSQRNCPYLGVAQRRPALCSVSVSVLARLLGHEVVREQRLQEGAERCLFRVRLDRPLAEGTGYEPEP